MDGADRLAMREGPVCRRGRAEGDSEAKLLAAAVHELMQTQPVVAMSRRGEAQPAVLHAGKLPPLCVEDRGHQLCACVEAVAMVVGLQGLITRGLKTKPQWRGRCEVALDCRVQEDRLRAISPRVGAMAWHRRVGAISNTRGLLTPQRPTKRRS